MNTQTKMKKTVKVAGTLPEAENPMQERLCNEVVESVEETAEAVFTALKREARAERGPGMRKAAGAVFVP